MPDPMMIPTMIDVESSSDSCWRGAPGGEAAASGGSMGMGPSVASGPTFQQWIAIQCYGPLAWPWNSSRHAERACYFRSLTGTKFRSVGPM